MDCLIKKTDDLQKTRPHIRSVGGNNYQIDQLATVVTKRHFGLSIPSVACDVLKARGCRVRLNPGWGGGGGLNPCVGGDGGGLGTL